MLGEWLDPLAGGCLREWVAVLPVGDGAVGGAGGLGPSGPPARSGSGGAVPDVEVGLCRVASGSGR